MYDFHTVSLSLILHNNNVNKYHALHLSFAQVQLRKLNSVNFSNIFGGLIHSCRLLFILFILSATVQYVTTARVKKGETTERLWEISSSRGSQIYIFVPRFSKNAFYPRDVILVKSRILSAVENRRQIL